MDRICSIPKGCVRFQSQGSQDLILNKNTIYKHTDIVSVPSFWIFYFKLRKVQRNLLVASFQQNKWVKIKSTVNTVRTYCCRWGDSGLGHTFSVCIFVVLAAFLVFMGVPKRGGCFQNRVHLIVQSLTQTLGAFPLLQFSHFLQGDKFPVQFFTVVEHWFLCLYLWHPCVSKVRG